jgi:catalase
MAKKVRNGAVGAALDPFRVDATGTTLTTNVGVPIADDQNTLRAGERGPSLIEDFAFLEKIQHFDHERIPERIVHARGSGAHGYFQVYESMAKYTRAAFLNDPTVKTPVFVRFSTVGGSRGSADTARDVRGFAVKFYTSEGNYDLVGNNMPVFFIQDAIKFPDFVHAVKPEPQHEMPQASSAHDTFYDFCGLTPESAHMVLWLMSDRAIPRSYRMMEGFGVHTFRLLNAKGKSTYVKFHWKPVLGMHSLVWDEAQKIAGKDSDFHRRDLYEAIEAGAYPEWELGVQLFDDRAADSFAFDILDPTKLVPEELVPVQRIGKMTLDRNPDSFFSETEQVAFGTMHLVPGIDFTNDPLLQGRNFSYQDTQLSRLGGPNFNQIPINQAQCPFHNNQRDGMHQMQIPVGRASYDPNSTGGNFPKESPNGFTSFLEHIEGDKRRVRADSFKDHFSQAKLFFNSMSEIEKQHIISAFSFELAKLEIPPIGERYVRDILANIDPRLTSEVCAKLGLNVPDPKTVKPPAAPQPPGKTVKVSPALSMIGTQPTDSIATRKIAILAADGVDGTAVAALKAALIKAGAVPHVLGPHLGSLKGASATNGKTGTNGAAGAVMVDHTLVTMPSVVYDAVYVPGGKAGVDALLADGDAVHFVSEAFKHAKAIAATGEGTALLAAAGVPADAVGVVTGESASRAVITSFIAAIAQHRAWNRAGLMAVPA